LGRTCGRKDYRYLGGDSLVVEIDCTRYRDVRNGREMVTEMKAK